MTSNTAEKKLHEKIEEFKKKAQNAKLHRDKTQSLNETKMSILKKDVDILSS